MVHAMVLTHRHLAMLLMVLGLQTCVTAQTVDWTNGVLPILQSRCIECHGPDTQESKLRLDTMTEALRGGNSGEPVIIPGDSHRSYLVERITSRDPILRMPPDSAPLSDKEQALLKAWIDAPLLWTEAKVALSKTAITHWSFQPVVRPRVLDPVDAKPIDAKPIDVLIAAKLREAGLTMSQQAEKRRLIRRLFLVMHGLPPTQKQVDHFLADQRPDAWNELVDLVLDSPRYGERWAMHWLDIVRFGETNGFETNRERPNAFPFRDWVIAAFNSDKPYDQFVKQQIAGDVLGEPVGTGFLVAGPNDIVKGQDPLLGLMQRQDELTDMVNTTGTAFLGLTTGCARCHNHKFDPISQSDFYALQAVFAGVEHAERKLPLSPDATRRRTEIEDEIHRLRNDLSQYASQRGSRDSVNAKENIEDFPATEAKFIRFTISATNAAEPCIDELQVFSDNQNVALASNGASVRSSGDYEHPLHKLEHINDGQFGNSRSWISSVRSGGWVEIQLPKPFLVERIVWSRDRQGNFSDRLATDYRFETSLDGDEWKQVASSIDRIPFGIGKMEIQYDFAGLGDVEMKAAKNSLERIQLLEKEKSILLETAKAYVGSFKQPEPTYRLHRGDPIASREQVAPGAIAALGELRLDNASPEQQRRLAIANWIVSSDNPLTARVMVNRLWQFHFGIGIVDTPSDFGANGTLPSHPELLDWLASEFMECGWSLKHMHRLILTSTTWQQDSRPRSEAIQKDSTSRLLWRFPPRRLEAEGIRDCMLAASGKLDSRMGGPGFSAFEVELENVRHYFPKKDYGPADWRRMVYMTKVRQEKDSIFGVFDCPDGSQVTPKRSRSTTPLQALNLLNSRFVMQQADFLAERIEREGGSMEQRISLAYELCFGRTANNSECTEAIAFVAEHGWPSFARAMLNTNEFIFIP